MKGRSIESCVTQEVTHVVIIWLYKKKKDCKLTFQILVKLTLNKGLLGIKKKKLLFRAE